MTSTPSGGRRGWLDRLGLSRPELRAWAMYDWAVSAVQTTIMVAVFPIFFKRVVAADLTDAASTQWIAAANAAAMTLVALLSPVLGALADYTARYKRLLAVFLALGASAAAGMFFLGRGDVRLGFALFVATLVGAAASMIFYEALLPHIAAVDEVDRVSTAGYGLGYLGGGVLLALNLAWILSPGTFGLPSGEGLGATEATLPSRLALLSVAVWWVAFSIPLFRRVPDPQRRLEPDEARRERPVRAAVLRLAGTLRELRGHRQAFVMLLAFLIYNDGIQTIIKMATAYGTDLGIGQNELIRSVLIVQFVGIPFAFLFGMLADRVGTKPAIFVGLAAYVGISILGYFMTSALHFFILAALVGMVQGGTQALSRSLFASMVPPHRSGEYFGFFSVFEKFAGIFGPLLFLVAVALTGSSRNAILSVIVFFLVGGALLASVDVEEGRREARLSEERAREARLQADAARG